MSKKMQAIDPSERVKIAQLQSEIKQDSDKKMEWLYSGDKIDRNAYLLGKPINKLLIEKEQESQQPKYPTSTIDLENKIREDPLFEIKKREIEAKRRILENPLKMKQIEQMLSKSKRTSSESSDSDSSYRRKKEKKKHKKSSRSYKKSKYSDSEDSEEKSRRKRHRHRSRSREKSRERDKDRYGLKQSRKTDEKDLRYSSSTSKNHLEVQEYKNRMKKLDNIRKSEVTQSSGPRKLSDEEKQRRLKEMEQNAKWRQEVREKNVKNYKNEERKEQELEKKSKSSRMQSEAALLFNSMMNEAYASTEDRIKRNVNKIQKSTSSLE